MKKIKPNYVIGFSDKQSHDLQNRLDQIINDLDKVTSGTIHLVKLIEDLRDIRDDIPCTCGEEYD